MSGVTARSGALAAPADEAPSRRGRIRSRALARFLRNKPAIVGAFLVLVVIAGAVFAPWLDVHPPIGKDTVHGLSALGAPLPPTSEFPLGTDMMGRCVCARLLYGARVSLLIGVSATLLALTIGVLVGIVSGFAGGLVDTLLMRGVDLLLSFPFLLLVIALTAIFRDAGLPGVLLVLGLVSWTTMARVIRGKVLTIRELEYVLAARALGAGRLRLAVRHVLPNVLGAIVVLASISVAQMILAESTLSYLSLGAPPPIATWGRMLNEGQLYLQGAPWLIAAPGCAVLVTVLGFNLLGEGLRDALDPKDRR